MFCYMCKKIGFYKRSLFNLKLMNCLHIFSNQVHKKVDLEKS